VGRSGADLDIELDYVFAGAAETVVDKQQYRLR
jgi:hypothetical protein